MTEHERISSRLPNQATGLVRGQEAVPLAVGLLGGLMLLVPAFAVLVDAFSLPVPLPLLVGVALVGTAYGVAIVVLRRVVVGSVVALIVLTTFKANVPVLDAASRFPKDVVGSVLLVHVPLVLLAGIAIREGWVRHTYSLPTYLFGGFVLSTTIPVLLQRSPSLLGAASFTLFALFGLVAYIVGVYVVAEGVMSFRTLLQTILVTVGAHAAFAVVQLLNQDPFGFTRLGEGGMRRRVTIATPGIGEASIGPFVSSFTGMSFVLAYLITLTVCVGVVFAARRRGRSRFVLGAGVLVMVAVLRASASDAARGAILVAFVTFGLALTYAFRARIPVVGTRVIHRETRPLKSTALSMAFVGLTLLLVGYPSSGSGSPVGSSGGTGGGGAVSSGSSVQTVSVPLFNVSNLGVRLQQYLIAIDLFSQFPLFGIGGMNYVVVAGEYGMTAPWNQNFPNAIHSVYFTLLAETGAVGTVLYLAAILAVLYAGLQLLRWECSDTALVAAVLAGMVGVLAYSAFGVLHLYAAAGFFSFWVVAGGLFGEYLRWKPTGGETGS